MTSIASMASSQAVGVARAAAQLGSTEGKLAYKLTMQVIKDKKPPLVFPLIVLSTTAVTEGLAAYVQEQLAAKAIQEQVNVAEHAAESRAASGH